jgi:selenide,water dikinase
VILAELDPKPDPRVLVGSSGNEDAAVVRFPSGCALVQTVDFLTPLVNDPWRFGQIAAANALSDVYAMGGEPLAAMNIVCFPAKTLDKGILKAILRGGLDKIQEAGAVLAGGHSVEDPEIKYGLSVSGVVEEGRVATNAGLAPGDQLLLTKPIGTGVLATALKGNFGDAQALEDEIYRWAGRLNRAGAALIRDLGLKAATDVTGFGLGGHLLEMAGASKMVVELWVDKVPLLDGALDLAGMGMLPAGSFANKGFCSRAVSVAEGLDPVRSDLMFDAQTSGGLVLAVPESLLDQARAALLAAGDLAAHIGRVLPAPDNKGRLLLR